MKFEQLAVIVPLSIVVALIMIIVFNGMPKQNDVQTAAANAKDDGHPMNLHTRPICDDSTYFRAEVNGVVRSCNWVAHHPSERCGSTYGTDNYGNHVSANEACFATCDTGNCRRRGLRKASNMEEDLVSEDITLELGQEEEPLN